MGRLKVVIESRRKHNDRLRGQVGLKHGDSIRGHSTGVCQQDGRQSGLEHGDGIRGLCGVEHGDGIRGSVDWSIVMGL